MADKAIVNRDDVMELCVRFGVQPLEISQLNGYDDLNFWIKEFKIIEGEYKGKVNEEGYVLKITNAKDSLNTAYIEGQIELLLHLGRNGFRVPQPIQEKGGKYYFLQDFKAVKGRYHVVRLLTFIPGTILKNVPISNDVATRVGEVLYKLDECMKGVHDAGLKANSSIWYLKNAPQIKKYYHVLEDQDKLAMTKNIISRFESDVLTNIDTFKQGIIHGDFNENNILVMEGQREMGILDFGDCHFGPYLFEVAIGLCYLLLVTGTLESGKYFLQGYAQDKPFSESELNIIKLSTEARLCQSLVLGLYAYTLDPGNKYVLGTQEKGWTVLHMLHHFQGSLI